MSEGQVIPYNGFNRTPQEKEKMKKYIQNLVKNGISGYRQRIILVECPTCNHHVSYMGMKYIDCNGFHRIDYSKPKNRLEEIGSLLFIGHVVIVNEKLIL